MTHISIMDIYAHFFNKPIRIKFYYFKHDLLLLLATLTQKAMVGKGLKFEILYTDTPEAVV